MNENKEMNVLSKQQMGKISGGDGPELFAKSDVNPGVAQVVGLRKQTPKCRKCGCELMYVGHSCYKCFNADCENFGIIVSAQDAFGPRGF